MISKQSKYIIKCDTCGKEEFFNNFDKIDIAGNPYFTQSKFLEWEKGNFCSNRCIAEKEKLSIQQKESEINELKTPLEKFSVEEEEKEKREKEYEKNHQTKQGKWIGEGIPKEERMANFVKEITEESKTLKNKSWSHQIKWGEGFKWIKPMNDNIFSISDEWDKEYKNWINERKEFVSKLPPEVIKAFKDWVPDWQTKYVF